jgi:uncharacterized membrane protein
VQLVARLVHGFVDADPIALGVCVALVVALAIVVTVRRVRRPTP